MRLQSFLSGRFGHKDKNENWFKHGDGERHCHGFKWLLGSSHVCAWWESCVSSATGALPWDLEWYNPHIWYLWGYLRRIKIWALEGKWLGWKGSQFGSKMASLPYDLSSSTEKNLMLVLMLCCYHLDIINNLILNLWLREWWKHAWVQRWYMQYSMFGVPCFAFMHSVHYAVWMHNSKG